MFEKSYKCSDPVSTDGNVVGKPEVEADNFRVVIHDNWKYCSKGGYRTNL